jgi:hypothetical protein
LWRIIPGDQSVYVDYSTDLGQHFSTPVAVNREAMRIRARSEDRPALVIDQYGNILVVFQADARQRWTVFVSFSADGGKHFTTPQLLSDRADQAKHYQAALALNNNGIAHLFWSDERQLSSQLTAGNALYSTAIDLSNFGIWNNTKVIDSICECCRIALDFDALQHPVVLLRTLHDGFVRDHSILTQTADKQWQQQRITDDSWRIQSCPEHGPTLSIGLDNQYHYSWFSRGNVNNGLFYANHAPNSQQSSQVTSIGNSEQSPGHSDVLVWKNQIALTWQEFDGKQTLIKTMLSNDKGTTWLAEKVLSRTSQAADYPFLLHNSEQIFVSWNSKEHGYLLMPIEP